MNETVKTWVEWLNNSRFKYMTEEQKEQTLRWLFQVRDKVLTRAYLKPDDTLIDIGTGTGLLAFGAYEILKNSGKVIASDAFEDCLKECAQIAKDCNITENFETLLSAANNITLPDNSVDVAVMRSVLVHILDKSSVINEVYRILKPGGRISIFEPIIRSNTRYHELINPDNFPYYDKLKEAETKIMSKEDDPLTNFDDKTLIADFQRAGFINPDLDLTIEQSTYQVSAATIDPWFNTPPAPGRPTTKERLGEYMNQEELDDLIIRLKSELDGKVITVKSFSAYISAVKY